MSNETTIYEQRHVTLRTGGLAAYVAYTKEQVWPELNRQGAKVVCLLNGFIGQPQEEVMQITRLGYLERLPTKPNYRRKWAGRKRRSPIVEGRGEPAQVPDSGRGQKGGLRLPKVFHPARRHSRLRPLWRERRVASHRVPRRVHPRIVDHAGGHRPLGSDSGDWISRAWPLGGDQSHHTQA